MKRAALGIRVHSGWGALVAVAGTPAAGDVIERERIEIADPSLAGAKQPYHFAQGRKLPDAERHLANCAASSEQLAFKALSKVVNDLRSREYAVGSCAILLAAGRALPSLEQILASHALIHTAEGEFFRNAFRSAAIRLQLQVTGIREKDLDRKAEESFGIRPIPLRDHMAFVGKSLGPPWTTDQKTAALAAWLLLTASA